MPYYYPGYPGYPDHYFRIDPSEYEQAKSGAKKQWYGWQTGLVHGLSVLTLLLIPLDDDAIAPIAVPLGIGGLSLGAPIVHWAHGYIGKGFGSLGLIVGGSLGAYFMTATTACLTGLCYEGDLGGAYAFLLIGPIGGGVAFLTTTILDYVFLAYEENDSPSAVPPPKESAAKWSVQPFFDIGQNRASFGIGGQF